MNEDNSRNGFRQPNGLVEAAYLKGLNEGRKRKQLPIWFKLLRLVGVLLMVYGLHVTFEQDRTNYPDKEAWARAPVSNGVAGAFFVYTVLAIWVSTSRD